MQAGDFANVLALDDGGVAGGLTKVRALITPMTVSVGLLTAGVALGTIAWLSYTNAVDKLAALSQGAGAVIGATGAALEANAEKAAVAGNISVSSAREIETGYVKMGGIGNDVLAGLTALTENFAKATGQEASAAQQQLGQAFQDPVKGAQELTERYGSLTQAQIQHIQDLVQQNDLYGAQAQLLADLKPQFDGAAEHANVLARAWHWIATEASDAWTMMGKAIDRAVSGGTTAERIADLMSQRSNNIARFGSDLGLDKQITDLQAQLKQEQNEANTRAANSARQRAANVAQQYQGDDRDQISKRIGTLKAGIAAGGSPDDLKAWTDALGANQHALDTWMPAQEKASKIASLDAQIAAAKTPATKAALTAEKERVELSGKVVTSADAEAQAHAKGAAALATASKAGAGHAATLAREAAAMDASARAALTVADAYLQSGVAGAEAEARRKALTDATKKGIDVDAEVRRALAISVGEAAANGAKSVSQLKEETAVRRTVNGEVERGELVIGQMGTAISDENALRDLSIKKALAYKLGLTEAYDEITKTIEAYKDALSEAHDEEAHGQALQSLDALKKRAEDARLAAQYAGDTTGAGERAKALLASNREADAQGRSAADRATNDGAAIDAANADLEQRRATAVAEMLTSQRDNTEQATLQLSLVRSSAAEQQRQLDRLQAEQLLRAAGVDLASDQARAVMAGVDAEDALNAKLKLAQDSMAELQDLGSRFIDDLTNPDGSGIKNLLKDIEQELIKLAAINPLKNLLLGQSNPTLGSLGGLFGGLFGGGSSAAFSGLDVGGAGNLTGSLVGGGVSGFDFTSSLAHFAAGSEYTSGGMAWVGENGPELVQMPRGSRVTNAADTRRMLAANDRGIGAIHVDASINAPGADSAALERVAARQRQLERDLPAIIQATVRDQDARNFGRR